MNDYTITVPREDLVLAVEALKVYQNELKTRFDVFKNRDPVYSGICLNDYTRITNLVEQVESQL